MRNPTVNPITSKNTPYTQMRDAFIKAWVNSPTCHISVLIGAWLHKNEAYK